MPKSLVRACLAESHGSGSFCMKRHEVSCMFIISSLKFMTVHDVPDFPAMPGKSRFARACGQFVMYYPVIYYNAIINESRLKAERPP